LADLQRIGNQALQKAPQPLRRALDGLGVQFKQENGQADPMAGGLGPGNRSVLAGVEKGSPNAISVLDPEAFSKSPEQLATHEGVHLWQNNLPPTLQKAIPADNPADPYNFGGTSGVKSLLAQGKGLANMPREQAAAAMQYGQSQGMPEPYNQLAHTMDKVPLSQIEMTDPMAKTLNMHPRAPQVPPSSTPGMNYANTLYQLGQPAPGDMPMDLAAIPLAPDLPASTTPHASLATPDPLQQNIQNDQQQLQKVRWAQANPWGTANNHPGTMGKIAHVLSVAGNIAGNIVAPNIMAGIPGTELHNQVEGNQLTHRLNAEAEEESQNQSRDAGTQATQLANAPEAQQRKNRLSDATAANIESETKDRDLAAAAGPSLSTAYAHAVQDAVKNGRDPSADPVVQHMADAITAIQKQPATKEANPQQQTYDSLIKGGMTPQQAYEKIREKPASVQVNPGTWSMAEDAEGHPELFNSKTGEMKAAPPGMQKSGTFAKNTKPTADEQRRADLSENLNENLSTLRDIVARRPELFGPLAGRWAELKQKFGSDDPDLGTLQTIQHQIGMAQISAHGMRSAQGIEGAGDSIMNHMHSGPHALLAAIDAAQNSVKTFSGDVENKGKPAAGAPQSGQVENGYRFKGGDPANQKNWEKVQ
jgi:hypothetical protein